LLVPFLLAIALCVLFRLMASDYPLVSSIISYDSTMYIAVMSTTGNSTTPKVRVSPAIVSGIPERGTPSTMVPGIQEIMTPLTLVAGI